MKKYFLLVTIFVILPNFSPANTQDKVMVFFNSSIEEMANHLNELERIESSPETISWDLKKIFLRVQAIIGIEVPIFASLKIVPEIEFIVEKQ